MPTNDERREVAKRLRECFRTPENPTWVFDCAIYHSLGGDYARLLGGKDYNDALGYLADLIEPGPIDGDTSDGYHTFYELYDHRAKLFSVVVAAFSHIAWKSKLHSDGSMYEGMFIVGIDTPHGRAAYHYEIEPYWEMFHCQELSKAPEWDGHTSAQAIDRIARLADLIEPEERTCRSTGACGQGLLFSGQYDEEIDDYIPFGAYIHHLSCGHYVVTEELEPPCYCAYCGAKVVDDHA